MPGSFIPSATPLQASSLLGSQMALAWISSISLTAPAPSLLLGPPHFPKFWTWSASGSASGLVQCPVFLHPHLLLSWSHLFSPLLVSKLSPSFSLLCIPSMLMIPKDGTHNTSCGFQAQYLVADWVSNRHLHLNASTTEFLILLPPPSLLLPLSSPSQFMAISTSYLLRWENLKPSFILPLRLFLSHSLSSSHLLYQPVWLCMSQNVARIGLTQYYHIIQIWEAPLTLNILWLVSLEALICETSSTVTILVQPSLTSSEGNSPLTGTSASTFSPSVYPQHNATEILVKPKS